MINFKTTSALNAIVLFLLFSALLIFPKIIFVLFQIPENDSAFFIARRAAMLFLGLAVITWTGRHASHSSLRQSVCAGLSTTMFALALLGVCEFIRGLAGPGILLAVIGELFLGGLYINIWLKKRKN